MSRRADNNGLGPRADAVFGRFLAGRQQDLHPADRDEAAAFWEWLGGFDRPYEVEEDPSHWWRWAAVAAILFLFLGSAAWFAQGPAARTFAQHYTTGHAERRVVRLADGSVITIAPDSRVDVAYAPAERRIRLAAGEALFEVAHNVARPFIVETPHGEVKAVGTAFDIAIAEREAEVTVVEGVIRIALRADPDGPGPAEPIEKLARKGERVAFGVTARDGGSTGFIRQAQDLDADGATAWTRGKLVFHGEPLRDVIAKINLYARGRVVLTDPEAGSIPVYGVVDQGDTAAIRELIANPRAVAIEDEEQ
ncbi:MAG TPA: FecR domain-containing protein [Sphingomonas sp.]